MIVVAGTHRNSISTHTVTTATTGIFSTASTGILATPIGIPSGISAFASVIIRLGELSIFIIALIDLDFNVLHSFGLLLEGSSSGPEEKEQASDATAQRNQDNQHNCQNVQDGQILFGQIVSIKNTVKPFPHIALGAIAADNIKISCDLIAACKQKIIEGHLQATSRSKLQDGKPSNNHSAISVKKPFSGGGLDGTDRSPNTTVQCGDIFVDDRS